MRIDVAKAQAVFFLLIKCAVKGQKIVITQGGKPVARLVGLGPRWLGSATGEFVVPDDFNDPLPKEIEDTFWE